MRSCPDFPFYNLRNRQEPWEQQAPGMWKTHRAYRDDQKLSVPTGLVPHAALALGCDQGLCVHGGDKAGAASGQQGGLK